MPCTLESYSPTIVGSATDQCSSAVATIETPATASKKYRRETTPGVMPDSTHRCPEYVWGDEGPVNESASR
jgi:hypothetical protein